MYSEAIVLYSAANHQQVSVDPFWLNTYSRFVLVGDDLDALNSMALKLEELDKEVYITTRLVDVSKREEYLKNVVSTADVGIYATTHSAHEERCLLS